MVMTKTNQKTGTVFLTIFLIVILISGSTVATIFTYSFNVLAQESTYKIPDWIKNNACWWNQDLISDDDFASGIEYLINQGIIIV